MTLEEQFQKETGFIRPVEPYCDNDDGWANLCHWEESFSEWLKEKLTWKKLSEQKPIPDSKVFFRFCGASVYGPVNVFKYTSYLGFHETEWLYVPE